MWSPQRYTQVGKSRNISVDVLQEAVRQIETSLSSAPPLPPILSLRHLANLSGTNREILRSHVTRSIDEAYKHFYIKKRSGGYRRISIPNGQLQTVQQWIAHNVLRGVGAHTASRAFCKGNSIVKCAKEHCNSKWLIKLDVADFFGSVTEIQVYRAFRYLGYNPLISFEMARISTERISLSSKYDLDSWKVGAKKYSIQDYQEKVLGRLPQGAPSSPMLSNLIMLRIDDSIAKLARERGLRYTRYSDDMTFSTIGKYSRNEARELVSEVSQILKKHGLYLNRGKTTIVPPGAKKVVLGLLVDGDHPNLTKEFKDKVRQHLFYLGKFGIQNHVVRREFDSAGGLYRHLLGLINFANMVDSLYAETVKAAFDQLPWVGMQTS